MSIKITVNNIEFIYSNLDEPLTDQGFEEIIEKCNYQDTGGGWRHTYKELTNLISAYKKKRDVYYSTTYYPVIKIEPLEEIN